MNDDPSSIVLVPMTFNLSRGNCPHCGKEIRIRMEKAQEKPGEILALDDKLPKPAKDGL